MPPARRLLPARATAPPARPPALPPRRRRRRIALVAEPIPRAAAADERRRRDPLDARHASPRSRPAFSRPRSRAPGGLIAACAEWIVAAGVLELLSALGFLVFSLVFARPSASASVGAALRALGASTSSRPVVGGAAGPAPGSGEPHWQWSSPRSPSSFSSPPRGDRARSARPDPRARPLERSALRLDRSRAVVAFALVGGVTPEDHKRGSRGHPPTHAAIGRAPVASARALEHAPWWPPVTGSSSVRSPTTPSTTRCFGRPSVPTATRQLRVVVMGYLGRVARHCPPRRWGYAEGGLIGALVLYGAPAAGRGRYCSIAASRSLSR